MKPLVKKIENPDTQQILFRGYVKSYIGNYVDLTWCVDVHTTRAEAEKDAKRLIIQIRKDIGKL